MGKQDLLDFQPSCMPCAYGVRIADVPIARIPKPGSHARFKSPFGVILTWGLLAALVIFNQLPGYISPKAMGSLDFPGMVNGWIWF